MYILHFCGEIKIYHRDESFFEIIYFVFAKGNEETVYNRVNEIDD